MEYYLVKDWKGLYAVSENGKIYRGFLDSEGVFNVSNEIGNYKATNVVLGRVENGERVEKAYNKIALVFDCFYPGVRENTNKAIKFKDGNKENLSKNNLTLSDKNTPNAIEIEDETFEKINLLRKNGAYWHNVKDNLSLDMSTEAIRYKYNKWKKG